MIQKMCPDNGIAPGDLVDKLFTYATPHNGIDFGISGLNIGVPQIAPFDAQIFNRKVMYQYLTPAAGLQQAPDMPAGWDAHVTYPAALPSPSRCRRAAGSCSALMPP